MNFFINKPYYVISDSNTTLTGGLRHASSLASFQCLLRNQDTFKDERLNSKKIVKKFNWPEIVQRNWRYTQYKESGGKWLSGG